MRDVWDLVQGIGDCSRNPKQLGRKVLRKLRTGKRRYRCFKSEIPDDLVEEQETRRFTGVRRGHRTDQNIVIDTAMLWEDDGGDNEQEPTEDQDTSSIVNGETTAAIWPWVGDSPTENKTSEHMQDPRGAVQPWVGA